MKLSQKELDSINWAVRADILNRLYMKRFGRQAPGHSEPAAAYRDANSPENRKNYDEWEHSGIMCHDALEWIAKLEAEFENET
jgi:hypothetical protein